MSFKELSHQRREAALFLRSPFASCQSTRYLTHTRHTSRLLFLPFPSSVLSLNGLVSFLRCWITFSAAHRHCTKNPLNSSSLPHSLPPPQLCFSASLCLSLSSITLSSLRCPPLSAPLGNAVFSWVLQARTPWSDLANKYLCTLSLAQLLKHNQFIPGIVSWTVFLDLEKAISSFCSQVPLCVCVWLRVCVTDSVAAWCLCLCITAAQCSLSGKWHSFCCSALSPFTSVAQFSVIPNANTEPLFRETFFILWKVAQRKSYTDSSLSFHPECPFIKQEPGRGRHGDLPGQWAEQHQFSIQPRQLKTKPQFDL